MVPPMNGRDPVRPADVPATEAARATGWLVPAVCVAGLVIGLLAAVLTFVGRDGFNEDELFQLAFVNQPLPGFFMQFVRLDQHPFTHFLQLVPWSWLSQSDTWMLGNSLAWHLVSCAVIWWVGRAWLGGSAGLLAAALFALTPQAVMQSATLRFYAMIPALAVAVWWLNVRALSRPVVRTRFWLGLVLLQVFLGYSHAIAFYFLFWIVLAAALQQRLAPVQQGVPAGRWRSWLLWQLLAGLLVLPQVALTGLRGLMARGTGEVVGGNNDPGTLIDHFGGMTAGWAMQIPGARWLGAGVFLLATLLGLWSLRARWMAAMLLVLPYAVATVIGWLLAPMFKTPVYSAMLVPFACLCLAAVLAGPGRRQIQGDLLPAADAGNRVVWRKVLSVGLVVLLAVAVIPASSHLNRGTSPYLPVVVQLQQRLQPGDVVVVAKPYLYWGVLRYAVAPAWGAPLDVLPPPSGAWGKVVGKLGPEWSRRLHLIPQTQVVHHAGVRYVIGDDVRTLAADAARVWQVERIAYKAPLQLPPDLQDRGVVYEAGDPERTILRLFAR